MSTNSLTAEELAEANEAIAKLNGARKQLEEARAAQAAADEADWPEGAVWRITYNEHRWYSTDARAVHLGAVAELTGKDEWSITEPSSSPQVLIGWVTAFLSSTAGIEALEAQQQVFALPVNELTAMLEVRD